MDVKKKTSDLKLSVMIGISRRKDHNKSSYGQRRGAIRIRRLSMRRRVGGVVKSEEVRLGSEEGHVQERGEELQSQLDFVRV